MERDHREMPGDECDETEHGREVVHPNRGEAPSASTMASGTATMSDCGTLGPKLGNAAKICSPLIVSTTRLTAFTQWVNRRSEERRVGKECRTRQAWSEANRKQRIS